jgi:hypothetical protein
MSPLGQSLQKSGVFTSSAFPRERTHRGRGKAPVQLAVISPRRPAKARFIHSGPP